MKYGLTEHSYNEIKNIITKYKKYQFKVFGSRARGDFKDNSDIDIAIVNNISKEEQFSILNDFDLLNIPYSIDIVFIQNITKKELLNSIERDGVIYE